MCLWCLNLEIRAWNPWNFRPIWRPEAATAPSFLRVWKPLTPLKKLQKIACVSAPTSVMGLKKDLYKKASVFLRIHLRNLCDCKNANNFEIFEQRISALATPTGLNVLKIKRNYILTTTANIKHTNLFHAFYSRVRFHELFWVIFRCYIYFGIYFE